MDELSLNWPQVASNYELYEVIRDNTKQHKIYRAICNFNETDDYKPNPMEVAVKIFDADLLSIEELETLRKEIQSTKSNSHDNVIKYYTSFVSGEQIWIVMELAHYCSIRQIMEELSSGGLEEPLVIYILYYVLVGLQYLHKSERAHRNLKGSHILVNKRGNIKLGDFAVSTSLVACGVRNTATTLVGTLAWMAPEVLEHDRKYTCSADIWSLGMVALELSLGKNPFEGFPPMKIVKTLCGSEQGNMPSPPSNFSKQFCELVSCCLQIDPSKRYSASKLLENKIFRSVKKKDFFLQFLNSSKRRLRSMSVAYMNVTLPKEFPNTNDNISDDDITETSWTFNEKEEQPAPIQVLVGETTKVYVIIIRTIAQTNLNFKLRGQELILVGKLPPLPSVEGIIEWKNENFLPITSKSNFKKSIFFENEIDAKTIKKQKQGTTICLTISKIQKT